MKWLSNSMNEFQSGQTESFPIATVEYFVPEEFCTQSNPQTEAVYIPINPVVAYKENFEPRRVYSLKAENEYELSFFDRCCKEKLVQKMLDIITNNCGVFQKPFEIILTVNKSVCEVMWVTDTVINHAELVEKTFDGGEYLKVDTCNRCPHIAQSVFAGILKETGISSDDMFEVYYVEGNRLLTLTPMNLLVKR